MNINLTIVMFIVLGIAFFITIIFYYRYSRLSLTSSAEESHNSYAMTNGHTFHLYPINNKTIYVYDSTDDNGSFFSKYSGNDGPYINQGRNIKYVLNWQGSNISIERIPNMRDSQPEYYLLGTKLPNNMESYKGRYILTDSSIIGKAYQGRSPPGFIGYLYIQPSGNDVWAIFDNKAPILFKKYIDNGFNAKTFKKDNKAIMFYDDWNIQIITPDKKINGTRI